MFVNYLDWVIKNRMLVSILCILGLAFSFLGLKNIAIESDYEVFFDQITPRLSEYYSQNKIYGRQEYIRLSVTTNSGNILTRESLKNIEEITDRLWQLPLSSRVDSLTNYLYVRANEDGDIDIEELFSEVYLLSDQELEKRKKFALNEPSLMNWLLGKNINTAAFNIVFQTPENDKKVQVEIAKNALLLEKELEKNYPNLEFHLTGSIMITNAFFTASTVETGMLVGIMLVAGVTLLGVFTKSILGGVFSLLIIIFSLFASFGISSWIGFPITSVSSSIPLVILAITIANFIHILNSLSAQNGDSKERVIKAFSENIKPISLTVITTVIGFLCLNFSEVPPYRFMGNTIAFGVIISFILTFTLFPCFLVFSKKSIKFGGKIGGDISNIWIKISEKILFNNKKIALLILLSSVAVTFGITKNYLDDSMITYFDEDTKLYQDSTFIQSNVSPVTLIHLSMPAPEGREISESNYINSVEKMVSWLREQREVMTVVSFTDVIKSIHRAMHHGDEAFYSLPDNSELLAQYVLLNELSTPYGHDLSNRIAFDKTSIKLTVGFNDISNQELRTFNSNLKNWMKENLPMYMHVEPTSPPLLFAYIWHDSALSNIISMLIAIIFISLTVSIAFKSLFLGFLVVIPNLFPAIVGFGVWGTLFGGKIDIASSMVLVVSLGIVVDDTIHLLNKYIDGREKYKLNPYGAASYALKKVGPALVKTTVVLTSIFMVLSFSDFVLNSSLGILTALLIVIALILDVCLFVFILISTDKLFIKNNVRGEG